MLRKKKKDAMRQSSRGNLLEVGWWWRDRAATPGLRDESDVAKGEGEEYSGRGLYEGTLTHPSRN